MRGDERWKTLGSDHTFWELHRFFIALAKKGIRYQAKWLEELSSTGEILLDDGSKLPVPETDVHLFFEYIEFREEQYKVACEHLRTEEEALAFCERRSASVTQTTTQSKDHHQSSKAMIAAVSDIAKEVCQRNNVSLEADPQARSVWAHGQSLHVSARNLDGAIPGLLNPIVIWEIKEYWGKTKGGSKMSDAVYECHLVGKELRDFEAKNGLKIEHIVFVDGKDQWSHRKADFKRFLDLMNQGFIDHLIIGREVERQWEYLLEEVLGGAN